MLKKLSGREKKILAVVILMIVGLICYHGMWKPIMGRFATIDDEIFAARMQLRKAKIYVEQREEILEEIKNYPNLERMDAGTDEEEIGRFLNFIEQTARSSGVSLADVKPEQVRSDKTSKQFIVALTAESKVDELISFIYGLQHSSELLRIDRVEVVSKEEKSSVLRSSLIVSRMVVK